MLDRNEIDLVAGRDVFGSDGSKIGTARQVYTDDETGEPAWATVRTGLFGLKESFLPLRDAELVGDRLTVPYTKEFVKDAPNIDEDGHLSPHQERDLYAFYGRLADDAGYHDGGRTGRGDYEGAPTGRGTYEAGRTGRQDSGTRHRDDLGQERRESGRARLRKYGGTERVTQTVPRERDQATAEQDPFGQAHRDVDVDVDVDAGITRGYN
jgi:hypothetical protein